MKINNLFIKKFELQKINNNNNYFELLFAVGSLFRSLNFEWFIQSINSTLNSLSSILDILEYFW